MQYNKCVIITARNCENIRGFCQYHHRREEPRMAIIVITALSCILNSIHLRMRDEAYGCESRSFTSGIRHTTSRNQEHGCWENFPQFNRVRFQDGHQFGPVRIACEINYRSLWGSSKLNLEFSFLNFYLKSCSVLRVPERAASLDFFAPPVMSPQISYCRFPR